MEDNTQLSLTSLGLGFYHIESGNLCVHFLLTPVTKPLNGLKWIWQNCDIQQQRAIPVS